MYTPPAYAEDDPATLWSLMRDWRFATLVSSGPEGPMATHLPVLSDRAGNRILTHIARNNPQWEHLEGQEVLLIFQGPQAFVSVNWYDNRNTFPTWNYGAIHVRGRVTLERDPEALRALLQRTIDTFDQTGGHWRFDQMPETMTAPRLRAILGIEIAVTSIIGKLKYNQDKSDADRAGVMQALSDQPEGRETACFMARLGARATTD